MLLIFIFSVLLSRVNTPFQMPQHSGVSLALLSSIKCHSSTKRFVRGSYIYLHVIVFNVKDTDYRFIIV
jgi:hypothetical protein